MIEIDGYTIQVMREAAMNQAEYFEQLNRPSLKLKPQLTIDGNQWCALYGESLQNGVAGFGDSPELAYQDFDKQWHAPLPFFKEDKHGQAPTTNPE